MSVAAGSRDGVCSLVLWLYHEKEEGQSLKGNNSFSFSSRREKEEEERAARFDEIIQKCRLRELRSKKRCYLIKLIH